MTDALMHLVTGYEFMIGMMVGGVSFGFLGLAIGWSKGWAAGYAECKADKRVHNW